jgi:alpha-tubulin suppressor-like RCC1 family protein
MNAFTPAGENLVVVRNSSTGVTHQLYTRTFPAGQVTLGGNQASGTQGMYTVILPPAPGARGPWVGIGTGWYHSCAIDTAGSAWCWGNGTSGRLGLGHFHDVLVPTKVVDGHTFASISGGANFTCAVATNGDGYCWGNNDGGQLGNGTTGNSSRPVPVAGGLKFRKIAAGQGHACGLTIDGNVYCWGRNNQGQNGSDSPTSEVIRTPRLVSGGHVWQSIGLGYNHSCGVTVAGDAYCWGQNRMGSVGDDSFTHRRVPTAVVGGLVFGSAVLDMSIDGGQNDTCAVGITGRGHCWGDQWHNQLGTNVGREESPRPTTVAGVPDLDRITVGGDHACGLTPLGEAWCWGDNARWAQAMEEQLDYTPPHKIATNYRFESLSGGWDHYCGVTTEGDMVCWGWNKYGQIGDGTLIRRYNPVLLRFP